ncbi:hypothetical protein GCM10027167_56740 [Nocardia heshunensis]
MRNLLCNALETCTGHAMAVFDRNFLFTGDSNQLRSGRADPAGRDSRVSPGARRGIGDTLLFGSACRANEPARATPETTVAAGSAAFRQECDVARDTEAIEREIEAARNRLASTLDELAVRADPQRLADNAKQSVVAKLNEPKIKYSLIGAGALIATLVVVKIFRR